MQPKNNNHRSKKERFMLNDDKLQLLFARLKLSPEARTLIETVCSAPPSRRLDSTGKSVFVQYASEI
jgi:hypothetical protein